MNNSNNQFLYDTLKGLSASNKYLSSKYFYDDKGSLIFQDIMKMPEYYLTDCEIEILDTYKDDFLKLFNPGLHFELIELGAGDGSKTKILLAYFLSKKTDFSYIPIDISTKAMKKLEAGLEKEIPGFHFNGQIGDYFELIGKLNGSHRKIILFLGSNIGNFSKEKSLFFLDHLRSVVKQGDLVCIGFDLKKEPSIIMEAYNDPHGHTAAFNLNLLQRINDDLGGDFNLQNFAHQEIYETETGTAKSYLVSKIKQQVNIRKLYKIFHFEKDERIFMEMSQKYDEDMIQNLAERSGFEIVKNLYDSRHYFVNSIWKLKSRKIKAKPACFRY